MDTLNQTKTNHEQVFFVIRHRLKKGKDKLEHYENWLKKIVPKAASFSGHLGVQIVRPPDGHNEYLIVVRFASMQELEFWQQSQERKQLINEIALILVTVVFGRLFNCNPDLVERFRSNAPLNAWDMKTFYGGNDQGYTDYPTLGEKE
jgi:heme-degrading monooxygenase HmoA